MLLVSEADFSGEGTGELQRILDSRYGKVKLIPVKGNVHALIVRTTERVAPMIRDPNPPIVLAGKSVRSVLTSGAVGNLKKRALEARDDGQVSQRRVLLGGPDGAQPGREVD